ncbi:alpha/beta hydrolase [Hoyosella rhizosphaerae]|uniref:Alpha/beta hydrolase n=1 Tax=Hoyosella rhizosphaerae TaxID=1755582 RepID=A0A916XIH2_9ACTN|nr:alpha/beta hydrolase [Hoyosella rhizosphaerae]MBN4925359.1 alpha/beta hydrolase [Hoyosella rhizosphaerae]GGC75874.1 alpha/beta hydrolase [Hoyosella rhizosphaerae]
MVAPDPSRVRFDGPWTHRDVHANGIRFHVAEMGPQDADTPTVLMLHGFGEFWWTWRNQLRAFANAGIRAIAVDLRGYGDTDKPPRGYDGWTLAGDAAGLVRALGLRDVILVGHAEGGLVCWATANLHPRQVRAIAVISSPHPMSVKRSAMQDRHQRAALTRALLPFQIPWLPERRLTKDNGAYAAQLLRDRGGAAWVRSEEFAEVAANARMAVQIPGAVHCALEYHRWAFRSQFRPDGRRFFTSMKTPLKIPVLQIHGASDPFILAGALYRDKTWAPNRELHMVYGVGHFVHEEAPQLVSAKLIEFVKLHAGPGTDWSDG